MFDINLHPILLTNVVNQFLFCLFQGFQQLIKEWPSELYNIKPVIVALKVGYSVFFIFISMFFSSLVWHQEK